MNNRDYKSFAKGEHYHLYNRGNGKMDIFREDADYRFLLARLREYISPSAAPADGAHLQGDRYRRKTYPGAFSVVCYCLMPNHFHLLLRQESDIPISTLMLNLWSGYSKYFNKKYARVGSLFQDQFKAILVDEDRYLRWLSAYIHLNPETAGIVARAEEYPFSSYGEYLGTASGGLCRSDIVLEQFPGGGAYRRFVVESAPLIREKKELEKFLIDA